MGFGHRIKVAGLVVMFLPTVKVSASINPYSGQIHGFLSQGYSLTSSNNFHGESQDGGSFDFREFGINLSQRMKSHIFISGQIISSKTNAEDSGNPKLDFLLLDYRFNNSSNHNSGIQIGRVKNPFGFYNETRDVPFTRPSVILPQSIYFDRTRDLTLSSHAVQLYSSLETNRAVLHGQLQVGYPRIDSDKVERVVYGNEQNGDFSAKFSYICKISYEQEGRGLQAALSYAELNAEYNEISAASGNFRFSPIVLSLQYNTLNWSVSGEYARRRSSFENLALPLPIKKEEGESYYLQFTWRPMQQWSSYARYDVAYLNRDDKNGSEREAMSGGLIPAYKMFALDKTLGIRWTINNDWEIAVENHWVDGAAWLDAVENPIAAAIDRKWKLFTANLSFRF